MSDNNKYKHLVIFDSDCLLCNNSVQFLLNNDTKNQFIFCSLKYAFDNGIVSKDISFPDSVVYKKENEIYTEASAFIEISKTLGWPFSIVYILNIFPVFILNFFYRFIAKNRYKIWGKTTNCILMSEIYRTKFLDFQKV